MAPHRRPQRRYRWECTAIGLVALGWLLLMLTGSLATAATVSNVGLPLAALSAAAGCASAAHRGSGRQRRTWALLGASALSWGCGMVGWTVYESVLGRELPFPSAADVGFLAAVPLAIVGLLMLPIGTQTLAGRVRTVLDGLMIAGSLLLISWYLVLGPVYRAGAEDLTAHVIAMAYPIADVVLVTIILFVLLSKRDGRSADTFPIGLVAAGLASFAVGDSSFAYLTLVESYGSGHPVDAGWMFGYLLLLAAARKPAAADRGEATGSDEHAPLHTLAVLVPYVAVVGALLASVLELWRDGSTSPFVSWIRSFLIVALVCRQLLTVLENLALTRNLEARVALRTAELRANEQRFEGLVQHSSDVIAIVDLDATVRYQSESAQRVFGYQPQELIGRSLAEFLQPDDATSLLELLEQISKEPYAVRVLELPVRHRSGRKCHAELTITNLLDTASVGGIVLNMRDVSERRVLEEQLVHQAFHDSLTALANRALFGDRVEQALQRARSGVGPVAVLFLDLDGFKEVNDSLGHASGDLLLMQVAERLRECVRPPDTVARFGGDEFAILVEFSGDVDPVAVAERITAALVEPFVVDGLDIHVRASIGIATSDDSEVEQAEHLIRNADLAMYQAKLDRDGSYTQYEPSMHARLTERFQLTAELRRALQQDEFVLHYQPILSLASGELTGAEALIRWQHPTRGLLSPAEFMEVAEDTGLINAIGTWVLREACRQASLWQNRSPEHRSLRVAVNLSGRQLKDPQLFDSMFQALHDSGLPPDRLVLEMTESIVMEYTEDNIALLERLRALGVRLAIDDFGTGYSSLSYLHRFPVDILKIDRSFIQRLSGAGRDSELVSAILQLGQGLRMETVAEGIEDHEQLLALVRMHCDLGQGFYFHRPMPPGDFDALLGERGVDAVAADPPARPLGR